MTPAETATVVVVSVVTLIAMCCLAVFIMFRRRRRSRRLAAGAARREDWLVGQPGAFPPYSAAQGGRQRQGIWPLNAMWDTKTRPPRGSQAPTEPVTGVTPNAPATPVEPVWLRAISGTPLDVVLNQTRITLGRSTDNDVSIDDPLVGRHHCVLNHDGGRWLLTDSRSHNGTFLNGHRLAAQTPTPVTSGSVIAVGDCRFMLITTEGSATATQARTVNPAAQPSKVEFGFGAATFQGGRRRNEDAHYASSGVVAVADGVGGRPAGDVAAQLAIDYIRGLARSLRWPYIVSTIGDGLRARGDESDATPEMATTLDAARVDTEDGRPVISGVHVGDGLAMLDDGVSLHSLTVAHTLGEQLAHDRAREVSLTPRSRESLVRGIGLADSSPDLWTRPAVVGHRYVLSTDGLAKALGARGLAEALMHSRRSTPQDAADALIAHARSASSSPGALDNLTVVIADVVDADVAPLAQRSGTDAAGVRHR